MVQITKKLTKIFLDKFPEVYGDQHRMVLDALGESFPLDLDSAKKLMEEIFYPEKFSVNLDELRSEFRRFHTEAYGGEFNKATAFDKVIIAMTEISPDEILKIGLEKAPTTSEKKIASEGSTNTPRPAESERKIPVRGKSTPSAKNEGKIPVRDQSKTTAQPNPAAKPSGRNKEEKKTNFRNDDYSISDASNYGEYFPGFRE